MQPIWSSVFVPGRSNLAAGEITKEAYDRWRHHYPDYDDTRIHAAVPPEASAVRKRGRKPKSKA